MQDFKQEILACVKPSNTPTKDQVKSLCQQADASQNALQTLQGTLFSRLERPKELKVLTIEIEHILVVIRQLCFISQWPFIDFFKDRLYVIASFCHHEDWQNPNGAILVGKAAMRLCELLRNDLKLNEERKKSSLSFSPPSHSIWLPTASSFQDHSRARAPPLLPSTPRRAFLPTPDASPVPRSSLPAIMPDEEDSPRREHSEVVPYHPTGEEVERTVRRLLNRSLSELLDSETTLKAIAQATFNENRLPIITSLFLEYILFEVNENAPDVMIKVLSIMNYCLKNGSPKFISALENYRDGVSQLKDRFHSRRINDLVKSILELLDRTGLGKQEQGLLVELGAQGSASSSLNHLSANRKSLLTISSEISDEFSISSIFSFQEQIKDLTPFVTQTDLHAFSHGGYASVYHAQLTLGKHSERVVKKVLQKKVSSKITEIKRVLREIVVWTGLEHPNVGLLYGLTREGEDRIGLISPFYERGDIVQYIKKSRKTLDNKGFLNIMKEITAGIVYLHKEDIIHGDVKGSNIMMDDTNHPRLIDFGVSRIVDVGGFTTSGNGTSWAWAAPELLNDDARKTRQSDIYALASTFVEMMIGSPPLKSRIPQIDLHEGKTPERPKAKKHPFYPGDRLWYYMQDCWAKKAEDRPKAADLAQFLNELGDITDDH